MGLVPKQKKEGKEKKTSTPWPASLAKTKKEVIQPDQLAKSGETECLI